MQKALEDLAAHMCLTGRLDEYEYFFDNLPKGKEDFSILQYVLGIYRNLTDEFQGFDNNSMLIGGYALIPHLAERIPDTELYRWRGSHDIDIVVKNQSYTSTLLEGFNILEDTQSLSIPNKRKIKIENHADEEHPVEIDLYYGARGIGNNIPITSYRINEDTWSRVSSKEVFGIPVAVPAKRDILDMKTRIKTKNTNLPRNKDMSDIVTLIGLFESEPYELNEALTQYSSQQKNMLGKVLELYLNGPKEHLDFRRDAVIPPSPKYVQSIIEDMGSN